MQEITPIRLASAANFYNVGLDHIVDTLKRFGFVIEDKPTFKLTPDMIVILNREFAPDRALKKEVNQQAILKALGNFMSSADGILDLSNLKLNTIPSEVFLLSGIKVLNLRGNRLIDLEKFELFSNLRELDLSKNSLKDLSKLRLPISLDILNLKGNQISDIKNVNFNQLLSLNLSSNLLEDFVTNLAENLITLNIDNNQINTLDFDCFPYHLEELSAQKNGLETLYASSSYFIWSLNLGFNQIIDLAFLENADGLTSLAIHNNKIDTLDPLRKCVKLNFLNLENNHITNVSPLENLKKLETLILSNNNIEDISPVFNLENLRLVHLENNKIAQLKGISNLKFIDILYLDNNLITDVEEIGKLNTLRLLSLSENIGIKNIDSLIHLPELTQLVMKELSIWNSIPKEVAESGWRSIRHWLNEIKDESEDNKIALNEAKILLLGNTNVGKSNFLNHFITGESASAGVSTVGITYKAFEDEKNLCKLNDQNATFHFWDFGGQEYFHATHKLFFSSGALHIVLWSKQDIPRDISEERFFELKYWLRSIQQLSKDDKITSIETIVVENKIDLENNQITPINQIDLKNDFKELNFSFSAVSLEKLTLVQGLKELLVERIKTLPTFSRKSYTKRYKLLLDAIKSYPTPVVEIGELIKMNFLEEEIEAMLPVFHNMGVILYFKDILPKKVFIKPLVLLTLIYDNVLTLEAKKNGGRLKKGEIEAAINKNDLNINLEEIIKLLKYFDLIFEIEDGREEYFAPQYLPEVMHGYLQLFFSHNFKEAPIKVICDSYLMNQALLRIFAVYGKSVKHGSENSYLFWKDGIVIEKHNQVLLIRFNIETQSIFLYTQNLGNNFELCKEIVDFILDLSPQKNLDSEEELGDINWYRDSAFTVYISLDGENYASYKKIKQAYDSCLYKFEDTGHTFNTFDFKMYLPKNSELFMKKIFISYSSADISYLHELEKHLSALKRSGFVESWHCGNLIPGHKWDDDIKTKFDAADIVLFLISPDFMATNYIQDIEVQKAFVRHNKGDGCLIIVPIVIRYCDWETQINNLQDFVALPYKAKPVKSFEDRDEAWYTIIERLKLVIKGGVKGVENLALPKAVIDIEKKSISIS